ncbi:exocyst complex component 4-like isoform X2 [Daphnia carinata]|uniref:exocyst complex component 4-like isoform X2 n=1 Tax=Daphnia carinata TaxID=120202 RepID=UPI00258006C4|nr:exocyst complex component 4-like isoform X2 [Daphnia carinata]
MAKETSGLLMNVIGTLSSLSSNEQRDREKAKLEREFKLSDQRLEKLVTTHHRDLANVMQIYSKASVSINEARTRIAMVKGQLAACRGLLHCRRDELKKLWLEGVEHKQVLLMLNQIEKLKEIPDKINENIAKKNYVAAAELVVEAQQNLQGPLQNVEALKDVRSDLATKQERFYKILLEDLSHYIYVKSSSDVLQWKRAATSQAPFQRASSGRNSSGRASGNLISKNDAPKVKSLMLEVVGSSQSAQDEKSNQCISNIVQCLSLVNRLPETLESLKNGMGMEMTLITRKTAQQISEMYPPNGKNVLKELFEAVMEQMRRIVKAHTAVLDSVKALLKDQQYNNDVVMYNIEDVWSQVQTVIQVLLSQYWDIGSTASKSGNSGSTFSSNSQLGAADLNAYFSRRRQPRTQKTTLFRFEGSLHSISLNESNSDYSKQDQHGLDAPDRILIVEPNARLVIEIYQPLMTFVQEIETALGCSSQGTHCALHVFITVFTRDVFLSQIHIEMGTALDEATRKLDMWKSVNPTELTQNTKATRPLLQSTIQVYRCLMEIRQLMEALPQFAQHFLGMACNMLLRYSETCQAAYRGLVQSDLEDKRVISATWAKDEDIHRFLRSLPSWTALQTVRAHRNSGTTDCETYEDSPEEIRQRSAKETEILTGNLGDAIIPPHEILADPTQLRILALLQESLEWFAAHIQELANGITRSGASESLLALPETNVQTLLELAKDFEDLADTCLLVLHLEVRVHCFYHLVPLGRQAQFWLNGDNQEPDPEIGRLSRDLTAIDESLSAFIQQRKHRYIFEGVSHLVSSIIMSSVQHIRRMNENGVKKMCRNIFALQQTLTSITLAREPALDHARQYFELLCVTPEEILNGILERGSQYTELEYIQVLQLLNRSRPGTASNEITRHLERLSEILGELGVTV